MPTFYNFRQNGVDYSFDDVFVPADLFRSGNLWTWGAGSAARLGNANITERSTPVTTFAGATNWKQVSSTAFITAAIKTDGTLWTWGGGFGGVLGNAVTTGTISTPITTFAGGNDWKQVSCGANHIAAIKTDGTLWTWGQSSRNVFEGRTSGQDISTPVTTSVGGTNWKQVSCGYWHTAAVKTDGSLWTWGYSYFGQLGRPDDYRYKGTPVTTFAGGTNWSNTPDVEPENLYTLSAGVKTTAAIKTDGTLWTWGYGYAAGLGNADTTNRSTPVTTFAGGTNWKQLDSQGYNMSAIKTDGTLWVWGQANFGQFGNGATTGNISTPITTFAGGNNWKQVSSGDVHTAAIKTDGTLWTWGFGGNGRLGNAGITNRSTPVTTFAGGTNWKQVSSGSQHTAAIKTDGTLWTWGIGNLGRLGNATLTNINSTPVTTFTGGTNWKQVSAGISHTAAIKTDGTLWIWGEGGSGQLGNADITNKSTPVTTFAGGTNWRQIGSGRIKTAAIKTDGTLWTWGYGASGQLGNAVTTDVSTPVTTFAGGTNWKQVSSGGYHIAALQDDGINKRLFVWGNGTDGRLGNATTTNTNSTPVTTFAGGTNWADVSSYEPEDLYTLSAGGFFSSAIKTDGTLWTWGRAIFGPLGNAGITNRSTPVTTFAGGTNWKQVSSGSSHTAAIKTDGTLWTWGNGNIGRLGNGITTGNRSTPVTTFAGGTDWKQVSVAESHTAAIKTDGTLWTWGNGNSGRLGNAQLTNRSTPVTTFAGGTNWKQVSAGSGFAGFTAAIKTDGTLWIWGAGGAGQLGDATLTNKSTPVTTFAGGTDWKQVSVGSGFAGLTAAIKTDGTLWIWGAGGAGQLGTNDTTNRSTPVTTFTGGTNWKQVSSRSAYTAAIKTDGTLWTWGAGSIGRLGNDKFVYSFSSSASAEANVLTPITTFAGGNDWKQVSCGYNHTLAIRGTLGNYQLFGFGDTYYGELGGAVDILLNSIPKPIFGNSFDWKQVDCGYHNTAAVKTDGTLWTWGRAQEGVLGAGGGLIFNAITPITTFTGGTNWKQVSVGGYYSNFVASAVKTDGTLWIWGKDNRGILGRGGYSDNDFVSTPITTFAGGTNWKSVSAGGYNVFGIKTDGTLWGWGQQYSSQLGVGDEELRSTPVTTFAGGTNWKQIDHSFGYHTSAVQYEDPVL
jgi:alpha-tubulin suppressor-like RCC1 family protein